MYFSISLKRDVKRTCSARLCRCRFEDARDYVITDRVVS